MVRSVQSVVELLQTHLGLTVNVTSAEVLRLNCEYFLKFSFLLQPQYDAIYTDEGNVFLRSGDVDQAIKFYDR